MIQNIIDNFPADWQAVETTDLQLRVCLEPCAISFLLLDVNNVLKAVEYFAWTLKETEQPAQIVDFLKQKSRLFSYNKIKTTVCFRTENVMFLPNELVDDVRFLLQVQFGFKSGEEWLQKKMDADVVVAWKINSFWIELFTNQFPGHACQTSLGNLFNGAVFDTPDTIYLAFGNGIVEIVAIFKQCLQLAKCFAYKTIEDLNYYLLNICKQLKVTPSEVDIKIEGFIEKESSLYRSLKTFFADVQTINVDNENWGEGLKTLPAHYFTGLINAK